MLKRFFKEAVGASLKKRELSCNHTGSYLTLLRPTISPTKMRNQLLQTRLVNLQLSL